MQQSFHRGTRVRIIGDSRRGKTGAVDSTVFQKTVDYPDEFAHGFHVFLDDEEWVIVRRDQVERTVNVM